MRSQQLRRPRARRRGRRGRWKRAPGHGELGGRRVVVAQRAEGQPDQGPRPGRVVPRAELLPQLPAAPQRGQRAGRVSGRQGDGAAGTGRAGGERWTLERRRDHVELVRGRAGRSRVRAGQEHLDGGRQHLAPVHGVCVLAEQPSYGAERGGGAAACQPQQRQAGLWLVAVRRRLVVRRGGRVVVAAQPEDLAPLVQRQTLRRVHAVGPISVHGEPELGECLLVGALSPHDLGSVHGALTGERDQARLVLAPPGQGRRPLGHPAEVADLLAGLDHRAEDMSRHDRRRLALDDPHHGLVEPSEALPHAPAVDQQATLAHQPHGEEVRVAGRPPGRADPRRELEGLRELTPVDVAVQVVDVQVAVLDHQVRLGLQHPGGTRHPALPDGRVAGGVEHEGDPERVADGERDLSRLRRARGTPAARPGGRCRGRHTGRRPAPATRGRPGRGPARRTGGRVRRPTLVVRRPRGPRPDRRTTPMTTPTSEASRRAPAAARSRATLRQPGRQACDACEFAAGSASRRTPRHDAHRG